MLFSIDIDFRIWKWRLSIHSAAVSFQVRAAGPRERLACPER